MAQPTKMMPTGIGAYGGSIEHDLYTNSTYGFSLKIPPGWVVAPVKTNLEKTAPGSALESHLQKTDAALIVTENAPLKIPGRPPATSCEGLKIDRAAHESWQGLRQQ